MFDTGLLSITFRKLTPVQVIELVKEAGLDAIEWGGDVHVPHGDVHIAEQVATLTRDAGIEMPSYGSYYRVGCESDVTPPFEAVLESALALGTKAIRVWAGNKGTKSADEAWWERVIQDGKNIADRAAAHNINIDYEFHANTLTDRADATVKLLKEINRPNVRSNWQPPTAAPFAEQKASLPPILPYLGNVHVFHWEERTRLPLADGKENWQYYIDLFKTTGRKHYLMLEFVKNDDPQQFLQDAQALRNWLS